MLAVLDPNVLISALLSPDGAPARVVEAWQQGRFEVLVSALLIAEVERALAYPKLQRRIPADLAERTVEWLRTSTTIVLDPDEPPRVRSRDPGDDYLLALAQSRAAALVSGDRDLLDMEDQSAILSPSEFLILLAEAGD